MKSVVKLLRQGLLIFAASAAVASAAERIAISWPTPNPAFARGAGLAEILQHAGSGDPASGGFGCVRTNDTQFHEGIDIKAVGHDRAGEPTDSIYAAMDGVVRYVNAKPGASNYGRYLVIEHPDQTPAVYTLYAHLSKVEAGIAAGTRVTRGQTIATMGRSSSGHVGTSTVGHGCTRSMGAMSMLWWQSHTKNGPESDSAATAACAVSSDPPVRSSSTKHVAREGNMCFNRAVTSYATSWSRRNANTSCASPPNGRAASSMNVA